MTDRISIPHCTTSATLALMAALATPVVLAQGGAAPAAGDEPVPAFDAATLADPELIKVGQNVWSTQCRHCHGNSAYPGKAPKLRPGMLEPDFIWDRVTYGFKGMPSWRAVFSPDERRAVVVYIKSDSFAP